VEPSTSLWKLSSVKVTTSALVISNPLLSPIGRICRPPGRSSITLRLTRRRWYQLREDPALR